MTNKSKLSDAEIAAEVKRAIAINAWLAKEFIATVVKDGVVTLTGTVRSSALLSRVSLLAWTAGVKSVNVEGLKIEPWAKVINLRNDKMDLIESDSQIKQAVKDAFWYDPRVLSFNPAVEVENGVVTLTGVVDNLKAKRAAEQDAKNSVGVWRVKNLLKVRPVEAISDDELAKNVNSAFLRDPVVDSYQIKVKAKNDVVTLTGTVDSYFEKAQADDIASRAKGVVNVKNNLTVSYPAQVYYDLVYDPYWAYPSFFYYWDAYGSPYYYVSDAEVEYDIKSQMFWSPWVNLDDITIKVAKGVATLTGTAHSWSEYRSATSNAYEGGAIQVYNNITVK